MYAISLTSIPPRFGHLGPVLRALLAQRPAPARVLLAMPDRFARFPGPATPPELPDGVDLLRVPQDDGPATKVLPAARALSGSGLSLIYCDDDWLMPPGWAARLLEARAGDEAVAAAGFDMARLKRRGRTLQDPEHTDVAQGYGGVLIRPEWLAHDWCAPPDMAWPVDDIWLSACLAHQGVPIRLRRSARAGMRLAFEDAHGLQDAVIQGRARHTANLACAAEAARRFGIWPERPPR